VVLPTIPVGPLGYNEIILEPSRGRTRIVETRPGVFQYQEPDEVKAREYADGRIVIIRNEFVRLGQAYRGLSYDFETSRLKDGFGNRAPISAIGLPARGETHKFVNVSATWRPLEGAVTRFRPAGNQEIIERVWFVNRDGSIFKQDFSYGRGEKYDRTQTGSKWRYRAAQAMGETSDPGPGSRMTTDELKKAVLRREFLVKTVE